MRLSFYPAPILATSLLLAACSTPQPEPVVASETAQTTIANTTSVKPGQSITLPSPAAPAAIVSVQGIRAAAAPMRHPSADRFPTQDANKALLTEEHPVSTFSVDVDTASYATLRRYLSDGRMPPQDAVRVEGMVNYFPYAYARPASKTEPFAVSTAVMPSPWDADKQLVHIALRGYDNLRTQRPPINAVLLIDVSGSMGGADRLPLLQKGFRLFAQQLQAQDRVAIVTYAAGTRVALEPTSGADKARIVDAIDSLGAGGGTAGEAGLQAAYQLAERHFDKEAVNRVILATDGDFNVGINDPRQLEKFIADKRKTGVYLSILGVGLGNLNDALIQRLAQSGNGNAAYIDSLLEARKAMSEEFGSTMFPIAGDVKVQVEFNPAKVAAYRLIGYETRMLAREDFNDDKIDAGDMGAGHAVTAIYEITPTGSAAKPADPLRYQKKPAVKGSKGNKASGGDELCFVKTRYKLPGQSASQLIEQPVLASALRKRIEDAPEDQRFAVAVAAFGQRLRGEAQLAGTSYAQIAELANGARGADPEGYRAEFVRLVKMAETLEQAGQNKAAP